MKNFAMVGVAGFVAPRHLRAIRDTGNELLAAVDPHDSVGVIDSYFPEASFFTSTDRFERHLIKLNSQQEQKRVHYLTVCSPNYLHDSHIRLGLWAGADVICEKPLVINPWNLDLLKEVEDQTGRHVYTVLQLRLLDSVRTLKEKLGSAQTERLDVELTYVTRRGKWYHYSWKGDDELSGGLTMNIGIHFFDLLIWLFGSVEGSTLHLYERDKAAGVLELQSARVRWFLSIDGDDLPKETQAEGKHAFRRILVDGEPFDLSVGFTDLHTEIYKNILNGRGLGIETARPAITLVHTIRTSEPQTPAGDAHPWLKSR